MIKIINVFLAVSITFLCCEINGGNDMAPSSKPDKLPEFASTDVVDGVTGQNNVVEPPEAKKDAGWNFLEKPSRNWMNWIHRKTWQWLVYFNQFFSSTHQFKINEIVEFDTGSGVTIDGSLIKDGDIKVDTITEKTTDSGVTIDGSLIKNGIIKDDGSNGIGIEEANSAILRQKIINIGDWDLNAFTFVGVAHLLDYTKIRSVNAIIRNDDDSKRFVIPYFYNAAPTGIIGMTIDSTYIFLYAEPNANILGGGAGDLDSTSYNRGWITIQYID